MAQKKDKLGQKKSGGHVTVSVAAAEDVATSTKGTTSVVPNKTKKGTTAMSMSDASNTGVVPFAAEISNAAETTRATAETARKFKQSKVSLVSEKSDCSAANSDEGDGSSDSEAAESQADGVTKHDLVDAVGQMRAAMEVSALSMKISMETSVQNMVSDLKLFLLAHVQSEVEKCQDKMLAELEQFKQSIKLEFETFKQEVMRDDSGSEAGTEENGTPEVTNREVADIQNQLTSFMEEQEKKEKALNIRLVGLPEQTKERTKEIVQAFCETELQLMDTGITEAFRIGKQMDRDRHIIVKFRSREDKLNVLKRKTMLKGKKIWINDDLTKTQLQEHKEQMQMFKEAKQMGKKVFWKRGRVVVEDQDGA